MENIMLDEKQKNVKLVDFGLSITFNKDDLMTTPCGSPEYAAPELFESKEKYGPEIDVWSLGIVMYVMMLGRLPFTTPYTDQYRRQKLVQQMEKGLTEAHIAELSMLSQDCQDMLRKVIEPSPERRMPLLDMELHPWVTNNAKLPFFPFQAFPKDKTLRQQGSPSLRQQTLQDSVCSTDDDETIATLSEKLEMKKEQVEQTVGETKSDEVSAMYNMMLDARRKEQGLYDIDHTSKPMERRDGRTKRRAKSAPEDKKSKRKGGAHGVSVDSAPHTGTEGTAEPETRMTSFDFLALCSAPTWLGPERRRSRRRTRSPNPAAQQNKNTDGDYMERQSQEAAQAAAADKAAQRPPTPSGKLSPSLLSPDHAAAGHSDGDGANPRMRRGSSFKLSRKRATSFGPRQKKRSAPFQRSGSMDTPMQAEEGGGHGRLQGAKSDSLATASPSTLSVAAASLAVAFGGRTANVLQVPEAKVGSRPETPSQKGNQTVKAEHRPISAPLHSPELAAKDGAELPRVAAGGARGSLTNVEVHVSDSAKKPRSPVHSQVNGPTALHVHNSVEADRKPKAPRDTDSLQLPSSSNPDTWSTDSLMGDSQVNLLPSPDQPEGEHLVQPLHLLDCSQRPVFHQQVPPHALSLHRDGPTVVSQEDGATAMQKAGMPQDSTVLRTSHPPLAGSRDVTDSARGRADKRGRDGSLTDLDPDLQALTLDGLVGATGISGALKDSDFLAENEVDLTMAEDDLVFSDAEQTPQKQQQQYLATAAANRAEGGAPHTAVQYAVPREKELLMRTELSATGAASSSSIPMEVLRRNKRGSAGSQSQSSSSGSRSQKRGSLTIQGGKMKTPTSPLSWVVHSPLARIESFHSDDFDLYNSSDNDSAAEHGEAASASPMSTGATILPCFAYKLNKARKTLPKLKTNASDQGAEGKAFKKTVNGASDVGRSTVESSALLEPTAAHPLLSSGGDSDHMADSGDRPAPPASKAKVHPEDKDCEKLLLKTESKPSVCNNVITQQPKRHAQQTLVNNCVPALALDPLRTLSATTTNTSSTTSTTPITAKSPPWTRSFVYFLKRKKPGPRCSNNNNNDCASSPMLPANHNGCSPVSPAKKVDSNNVAGGQAGLTTAKGGLGVANSRGQHHHQHQQQQLQQQHPAGGDFTSAGGLGDSSLVGNNCKARVYVPAADSNLTECPEFQTTFPAPPTSPDAGLGGRVFDFTLLNDSPKSRPCLLSWRPCGDCATSDVSSEDESECNLDPVVTLDLKPLGSNNVGDRGHAVHTSTYQCSGT